MKYAELHQKTMPEVYLGLIEDEFKVGNIRSALTLFDFLIWNHSDSEIFDDLSRLLDYIVYIDKRIEKPASGLSETEHKYIQWVMGENPKEPAIPFSFIRAITRQLSFLKTVRELFEFLKKSKKNIPKDISRSFCRKFLPLDFEFSDNEFDNLLRVTDLKIDIHERALKRMKLIRGEVEDIRLIKDME